MKLSMWERIENNRYYIGSQLIGTFIGNDDIGYISQSTIKGGNGYRKTLKQTVQQLRNISVSYTHLTLPTIYSV